MNKLFKTKRMMLPGGFFYILVVYGTYLTLGFGILKMPVNVGVSQFFYAIVAIIAVIAGLLEIKNYFWYGNGFTLQMLPGGSACLEYYTKKSVSSRGGIQHFYSLPPRYSEFLSYS